MRRRSVLRSGALGVTTLAAASLAGCSSDDGNGNDGSGNGGSGSGDSGNGEGQSGNGDVGGDDATTAGDDGTDGTEAAIPGEVLESSVPSLSAIGHRADPMGGTKDIFRVELTVENTGGQRADLSEYGYGIAVYDAADADITHQYTVFQGDEVASGETGTVSIDALFRNGQNTSDDVARYEVSMQCDDYNNGIYCQEETTEETATEQPGLISELPTYTFAEGESYTYSDSSDEDTSEETWSVVAVDGDELTVERVTKARGETKTRTISGTHETIYDRAEEELQVSWFVLFRTVLGFAQYGELTAGNTFTVQAPSDSDTWVTRTVEVQGDKTVNGVTCTEFTATVADGEDAENVFEVLTACVADGYPFAVSLSLQSGELTTEFSLIDATRP